MAGSCVTLCCPRSSSLLVLRSLAWERLGGFGRFMAHGLYSGFGCEMGRSRAFTPTAPCLLCLRACRSDCWLPTEPDSVGWPHQADGNPKALLKSIHSQPLACFCQWLWINPRDNLTKTQANSPLRSSGFPPLFHSTCAHSREHRFRPAVAACARWKENHQMWAATSGFKACTSEWGSSVSEIPAFAPESATASFLLIPASIFLSSVCQQDPNL